MLVVLYFVGSIHCELFVSAKMHCFATCMFGQVSKFISKWFAA